MRWLSPTPRPMAEPSPGKPGRMAAPAPRGSGGGGNDIIERIVLYVPTEIVAVFTMLLTAAVSISIKDEHRPYLGAGLIIFFLIITIAYIIKNAPADSRNAHLLVSPLAFVAWAYPISSSILGSWFVPVGAFALQAVVLAMSIFIRP